MLHPQIEKITKHLSEERQNFMLSTNASTVKPFLLKDSLLSASAIVITLPGFSEYSFKAISRLDFAKVRQNTRNLLENARKAGFAGKFVFSFHLYKFNSDELENAQNFAIECGAAFNPYYPYFNGLSLGIGYLKNTLPEQYKREAEEKLQLAYLGRYLEEKPEDYVCPQTRYLTLDVSGNHNICCAADIYCEGYILGTIGELTNLSELHELKRKRLNREPCLQCRSLKLDWLLNNPYRRGELSKYY